MPRALTRCALPCGCRLDSELGVSEKEWLDTRFCTEATFEGTTKAPAVAKALRAPSVCGQGMSVQCHQAARLGDAWAGMNGGCGNTLDSRLVSAHSDQYIMPMTALFNQIDPEGWRLLTPATTRVASSIKQNALDQLVCMVKDCFETDVGHPVDENGRRREECFGRRAFNLADTEYKARFDPEKLAAKLDELTSKKRAREWWHQPNFLDRGERPPGADGLLGSEGLPLGFGRPNNQFPAAGEYYEASVEDLTAFEFAEDSQSPEWWVSLESWTALLQSLGAPNEQEVVMSVLRGEMRGRKPRRHHSHTEAIHDAAAIKELLIETRHAWMWRD